MHILYVPFSLSYNVLLVRRHGWFGCLISLLFRTIVDRFHSKISSILFFFHLFLFSEIYRLFHRQIPILNILRASGSPVLTAIYDSNH